MALMTYHVFLSFGEDTRKTFSDHLYTSLSGAGFRTFRDDNGGIERGENVKSELKNTINKARSSIIVFSKGYASSKRCLEELVMILEHKKTPSGAGHVVLPVFYDVDPSQVRKQSGSFGEALEAFIRDEEQLKAKTNESTKECLWKEVQKWRTTLKEVADLAGMVLQNQADGHESKLIQEIVREIGYKVNRPVLHVPDNLIGIESRVKNINSWLQDESNTKIAVLYGMGGIGKTTIAKVAYNLNNERFEASSFLADVRENSKEPKDLVRLQKQLLSDILKREKVKIWNKDEGIRKIKDAICCKRVLVVLDDVDDKDQFYDLIGLHDGFCPGSKIILTTRNIHVLKASKVDQIFEVMMFDFVESLKLFSWHAFRQSHPVEGYTELSKRVVQNCGGLPLALQVLGSSLVHESLEIWKATLEKLVAIPNSEILKKLRISYDCLDYNEKELFLHIACFFIGKGKEFIVRILSDLSPTVGIRTLIDRSLLTINGDNKLMMHQLLQEMGVEIVRQESLEVPGKRSRLCDSEDSFQVLSEKTGTETIKGLYLDSSHVLDKDNRFRESFGVGNVMHRLSLSFWRPTNNVGQSSYHAELTNDAFARMHNLKLLLLKNVEIKGRFADLPKRLRYLSWHGFPLTSIPTDFFPKGLVDLDLRYSKLEQVWKGKEFLTSLKILNFSHSHGLKNTPVFTGLPNLEKLVLKFCISLTEVHGSIGELKSLIFLNLKGCKNLQKLPSEIVNLTSLETFILSGCSKLDQLPGEIEHMKSIKVLHADGISQDIGKDGSWASRIQSLVLRKSPKMLPCLPGSLVELSLKKCGISSDALGNCLGGLSVLKRLDLSGNPISNLQESIKVLTALKFLSLQDCTNLRSLPELPTKVLDELDLELDIQGCSSLETMANLPNTFKNNHYCPRMKGTKVVEVQGLFKLEDIRNADAKIINKLGLSSELETMGSLEMEYGYPAEYSWIKKPLQVLYECGIYSIFLPGGDVPASWRSGSDKRMGTSIKFIVPTVLSNLKIQALKIYVVFGFPSDPNKYHGCEFNYVTVNNMTKGLAWSYSPWFERDCPDNDKTVWLSHWKIGDQITLEAGDEVNVSAGLRYHRCPVEEIGVQVVYDEAEEDVNKHHKASSSYQNDEPEEDIVSPYQLIPGYFHLCHYSYHFKFREDEQLRSYGREEFLRQEFMFQETHDGIRRPYCTCTESNSK